MRIFIGGSASSLVVADVSGDGAPDMIAGLGPQNEVVVAIGDGSGGFAPPQQFAAADPRLIAVAELTRDDAPDVVTVASELDQVWLLPHL